LNSAYETGIQNPLDRAVLDHPRPAIDGYQKLDEVPFDFERRCISVVVETQKGGRLLITKSAPESVVPRCTAYEVGGARVPLDEPARAHCGTTYEALSEGGERVLAVAYREIDAQPAYGRGDEQDLVLAGFAVFNDAPMPGVREALAAMARDGVTVKLVTGDNERVARHVCGEVGLDATQIILGAQIEQMTDPALAAVVERTHVFARVSPGQKNRIIIALKSRIIIALKSRNHVVGYLGDGINDAPSLHAADVGISVANAVDVAKDAADIILLEPSLAMLHEGILEGRRAFGNIMKYLLMGTSSNFGNMFSMAAGIVFLPFLPMLPLQILLNNFLYDLAQVTIPTDNVDESFVMKPQRWDIAVIRKFMLVIGPISSLYDFATFFVLLRVFHAGEALFHTGWFVESLATQTLVLFVIRTAGNPLRSRPSAALAATTLLIVAVAGALPYMPFATSLGFVPLPASFFMFLTLVTATYLAVVEVVKRRLLRPQPSPAASAARV
jgi:Mg2+-importing ATPase